MLNQLPMPLPLDTPKGKAWAVAIIDYGPHWDLLWVTFLHETGECWTFNNKDIRQEKNYTFGLTHTSPIPAQPSVPADGKLPEEMFVTAGPSRKYNAAAAYNGEATATKLS